MSLIWRVVLVLLVFAGCGLLIARVVIAHEVSGGAPVAQISLAGAMAGLFGGGAVASLLALVLAFGKRRQQ